MNTGSLRPIDHYYAATGDSALDTIIDALDDGYIDRPLDRLKASYNTARHLGLSDTDATILAVEVLITHFRTRILKERQYGVVWVEGWVKGYESDIEELEDLICQLKEAKEYSEYLTAQAAA